MIEPTDEMVHAFMRGYADADDGSSDVILNRTAERAGLAAVLALVERDYVMRFRPCGVVFVEKRPDHWPQSPCAKPRGHENGPDTDWKRREHSNGTFKWPVDP